MSTESRLENLFNRACEIEAPEARAAFVEKQCGGDPLLRHRLTRLLAAHDKAGHFLNGGAHGGGAAGGGRVDDGGNGGEPGRIGDYRIIRLIGEGAFSKVYLAEQEGPVRRWVALKVIKAGMDSEEVILRFRRERQVLALMDHPGIAKVFEAGTTPKGRPFFAMEWVRGLEITAYCDKHRLPVARRLELFCQVCLAVMHAHQKGVIHRDLKPPNILVGENDGQPFPKVIDFGIVKVTRELARGTPAGTWGASPVGTPAYMSPEQARVGTPDVDTRSDIYSLGALLYELLTAHQPYDERSFLGMTWENIGSMVRPHDPLRPSTRMRRLEPEELAGIAANRRATPHSLCRMLEDDLDWIVLRALEKEREKRYQSVGELVEDIRRHLDHRPVSAAAPSLTYRLRKMVGRNRRSVAVAAVIAGLLVAGTVVSSRLAVLARARAQDAQSSQVHAEGAEREARLRLIEVNVAAGLAANERSDHDDALLWFATAAIAAEGEPDERAINLVRARNWLAWNALPVAAFRTPSAVKVLQFDPRCERLMTVAVGGACAVWDLGQGAELPWVAGAGPVAAAGWSPDGHCIALAPVTGPVEVRRVPDGELVVRFGGSGPATAVAFSPDGRFFAHGSRHVVLWDLEARAEVAGFDHPGPVSEVLFSQDSQRLATACSDGLARVFDLSPGPARFAAPGEPLVHRPAIRQDGCVNETAYREGFLSVAHASALAFLDRGRVLATRSDVYEITLWEIGTGRAISRFDRICCSCNFRVSDDGSAMACGMHGNVVGVWDPRSGGSGSALLPQGGCVFDVAFGPRGELLLAAGADHSATFWSLAIGDRVGARLHHFNDVMNVAFGGDGRLVATAQADGLIRIWKVPAPGGACTTLGPDLGPERVRLGGNGRLVVSARDPAWATDFSRTRVFDVASGEPAGPMLEFPGTVHDAAVSPDGRMLAVVVHGSDAVPAGSLRLVDVTSGERLLEDARLPSLPMALCWHPTEPRIGLVCRDGEVGVATVEPELRWSWLRGKRNGAARERFEVAFAPDGTGLLSLGPGKPVKVWHPAQGGRSPREVPAVGGTVWSFSLSASGRFLATSSVSGNVVVWDLERWQPAGPILNHPGWVYHAAFAPGEDALVTSCHDGYARVWDWREGRLRCPPLAHTEHVLDAEYTPDGRWIVTACRDGAVRVWDPRGGGIVMPPVKVGQQALDIAVSPDGRHAVIGSLGQPVRVLSLPVSDDGTGPDPGQLLALGEVLSNAEIRDGNRRELTAAEWLERFRSLQRSGLLTLPCLAPGGGGSGAVPAPGSPTRCGESPECSGCLYRVAVADPGVGR